MLQLILFCFLCSKKQIITLSQCLQKWVTQRVVDHNGNFNRFLVYFLSIYTQLNLVCCILNLVGNLWGGGITTNYILLVKSLRHQLWHVFCRSINIITATKYYIVICWWCYSKVETTENAKRKGLEVEGYVKITECSQQMARQVMHEGCQHSAKLIPTDLQTQCV